MPEVLGAGGTVPCRVAPAVSEKQGPFLGAQITGSLAVDMGHAVADQLDGIVGRDHPHAPQASPFDHSQPPRQVKTRYHNLAARCYRPVRPPFSGRCADDGTAKVDVPAVLSNDLAGRHHRVPLRDSRSSRLSSASGSERRGTYSPLHLLPGPPGDRKSVV